MATSQKVVLKDKELQTDLAKFAIDLLGSKNAKVKLIVAIWF